VRRLAEVLFWWAVCVGVWLLTLSSISAPEVVLAAAVGLPCAVMAVVARRAAGGSWLPRPAWSRWSAALPGAVLADTVRVLGTALGVLTGHRIAAGELRRVPLPRDPRASRRHARQAVATFLVTAAPGTIVLDVDENSGEMLVHALATGPSRLEKAMRR
jgi:multisubunit Na+/H+ antiporter MnhE subunit